MVEGISGVMTLSDEREDTVARFVQWAYTGNYPDPEVPLTPTNSDPEVDDSPSQGDDTDMNPILMAHARLYVFADRFNVQKLKKHTFDKLTVHIMGYGVPATRENKLAIIHLTRYTFGNLPECKTSDPLLVYLGLYASWCLSSLRTEPEFFELLEGDFDFMKELFAHVENGRRAPWEEAAKKHKLLHRCKYCSNHGTVREFRVSIGTRYCNHCDETCVLELDGEPVELS